MQLSAGTTAGDTATTGKDETLAKFGRANMPYRGRKFSNLNDGFKSYIGKFKTLGQIVRVMIRNENDLITIIHRRNAYDLGGTMP